ncbi:MAG: sugar phosphate nucleotidyltransferase [Streptosporangiaceae bacterium]
MTGTGVARVVIAAGGLGTRVSAWSRYLPKEFYPVDGRPGITHLLDEITALAPAEAVLVYHPYYERFAAWARAALSQDGADRYRRAAGLIRTGRSDAGVTLDFIAQRGPYADITSVLNGADHLAADGDLYVMFADNLYPAGNPLPSLLAAPSGHVVVLARAYQRELAAARGVIAATRQDGHLLMTDLTEKPDQRTARDLELRHGAANLLLLEGRARLTPAFIRAGRCRQPAADTEPKLALAIADWARSHPVIVTPTASPVIDLGASPRCSCTPCHLHSGQHPATPALEEHHASTIPRKALRARQLTNAMGHRRWPVRDPGLQPGP